MKRRLRCSVLVARVLHVARRIVKLHGGAATHWSRKKTTQAGRYRTIAGSAFSEDLGEGYDLVLLTNFLPDFDAASCERLLMRVHAALVPGGRAVALQYVRGDDHVSTPVGAYLGVALLATTPGGENYTFGELDTMFRNAGFLRTELRQLPEQVVIAYR